MSSKNTTIQYVTYESLKETTPKAHSAPWPALAEALTQRELIPVHDGFDLTDSSDKVRCKHKLGAIDFSILNGPRSDKNVTHITGLWFDIDNDTDSVQHPEDVIPDLMGTNYVIHATFSSTDKRPKWRLILPFKEPIEVPGRGLNPLVVNNKWYKPLMESIADHLSLHCDTAAMKLSQLAFLYRQPDVPEINGFDYKETEGEFFNPAPFIRNLPDLNAARIDPLTTTPEGEEEPLLDIGQMDISEFESRLASITYPQMMEIAAEEHDVKTSDIKAKDLVRGATYQMWERIVIGAGAEYGPARAHEIIPLLESWHTTLGGERDKNEYDYPSLYNRGAGQRNIDGGATIATIAKISDLCGYSEDTLAALPHTLNELFDVFAVTDADVADLQGAEFLYEEMIVSGHIIGIVGYPTSGKTAIMEQIAGYITKHTSKRCLYVNADASGSDIPRHYRVAKRGGYTLACPDLKKDGNMKAVIQRMAGIANSDEDVSQAVFIIDTLKKAANVIHKGEVRALLQMFRKLTARGATIICLMHTNKYNHEDWPMYEGSGDIRSDVDELVLLYGYKNTVTDVLTTSLYWAEQKWPEAKARALVEPLTWEIEYDKEGDELEVRPQDRWVDTRQMKIDAKSEDEEAGAIEAILQFMRACPEEWINKTKITRGVAGRGCSNRKAKELLEIKAGGPWEEKAGERNATLYRVREIDTDVA